MKSRGLKEYRGPCLYWKGKGCPCGAPHRANSDVYKHRLCDGFHENKEPHFTWCYRSSNLDNSSLDEILGLEKDE